MGIIPFNVNTHKSGSHAATALHGALLNLFIQEEQDLPEPITSPRQLSPRSLVVASKITDCGAVAARPVTPRKSVCQKITQADAVPLSPRFRTDVCGKITGDGVSRDPTCLRSIVAKVGHCYVTPDECKK